MRTINKKQIEAIMQGKRPRFPKKDKPNKPSSTRKKSSRHVESKHSSHHKRHS